MVSTETIEKAIAAHAGWKARLRNAVESGSFDDKASIVRADNRCDFGKWLYGSDLQPQDKEGELYHTVLRLHADFHQEAAKVVELATSGQKAKARESIALGGAYAKASRLLTEAMMKWRTSSE